MRTVWKFPFALSDRPMVRIPRGGSILRVDVDHAAGDYGVMAVWAQVDTENPLEDRPLFVTGTGQELPDGDLVYLGSIMDRRTRDVFVWHVWEHPE